MNYLLILLLFVTTVYARSIPRRPQHPFHFLPKVPPPHHFTRFQTDVIRKRVPHVQILDNSLPKRVDELERKVDEEDEKLINVFKNEKQSHRNLGNALKSAVLNGDKTSVGYILDLGADIDTKFQGDDLKGRTALHIASEKGFVGVVKELLKRGATINIADIHGSTPLHYAAYNGKRGTAKALLDYGANAKIKNQDGTTPLQDAIHQSHEGVAEEIRAHLPETIPEQGDAELDYFVNVNKEIYRPRVIQIPKRRPFFLKPPHPPMIKKHKSIGVFRRSRIFHTNY